ncbi:Protein CBG26295 [Caenorhabditis briggsae]|uniref:Protein CBG26295 n=1 Tax=Caenorhabditis briggsae TaxID=6238 RepID=B6IG68_CAEBR|nr:Protein CBG26295 [Caenorhabditis briggsae]CAR98898.1 Protein CBG26295 [Caenorhabditis briggsae]
MYTNGTYPIFVVFYITIIILNSLSILYYIFNLFVTFRVKHYKTNIQILHQSIYATCPFTSIFIITDASINILGKREFYFPMTIVVLRTLLSCPRTKNRRDMKVIDSEISALFALFAIMLERLCATYFVADYERNQRPIIGYSIIFLTLIVSAITSYIFMIPNLVLAFVAGHLISIVICYFVSLITYRINRKYFYQNRVHRHSYSLGERYQISENIRLYKFFSHYLFVLAIFPLICTFVTLVDHLDSNPMHREVYEILFDLSYTFLCILAPYLTYKMSDPWQAELESIFMKLGIRKSNIIHATRSSQKTVRGTFGEEMNVETSKHTDVYFTQLKSSWNLNNNQG